METNDPDATGPQRVVALEGDSASGSTSAGATSDDAALLRLCRDVLAPLITADGGVMYLVKSGEEVHVHLTGTCAGCPGAALTRDGIIAPAVRTVMPKARVVVTTGPLVPEGAQVISRDKA